MRLQKIPIMIMKRILYSLSVILIFSCEDVSSNGNKPITNKELSFRIEMLDERGYGMYVDDDGEYHITISSNSQSIYKMMGITGSSKVERITWRTKEKYYWSDGIRTDFYSVVNPSSYTKDSVGYSMVGFLPEMKGKTITIYGIYCYLVDSVVVSIK